MAIQSNFTVSIEDTNDSRVKRVFVDPWPLSRRKLQAGIVVDGTFHFINITPEAHKLPLTPKQQQDVFRQVKEAMSATDGQNCNLGT